MVTDDTLRGWRDAAVAGELPDPGRDDRWQVLRAGVVNLWEFGVAEYWYADGWAQLMGGNETGKSSLMALTTLIPWLADVASTNIDTLGRSGKHFRYYVEPSGNGADRRTSGGSTHQGWLWVEYGRVTAGGNEFFTVLLFAEARSAASALKLRWCTLAGTRVRRGCALESAGQVSTPKDLEAVAGFIEHPSATAYRACVATDLLGSTPERLDSVGKLLKATRTPKLGEQLQVNFIRTHLQEALPSLDRNEIEQLAEGWDQLDGIRGDLEQAETAVGIVKTFVERTWQPWLRARLRQSADLASDARTAFDGVTKREREAQVSLDKAQADEARLEAEQADAEQSEATNRSAAESLQSSARYRDVASRMANLQRARDEAARLVTELAAATQRAEQAQGGVLAARTRVEAVDAELAEQRARLVSTADALRVSAVASGIEVAGEPDPVLIRQQVTDRRRDVGLVRAKVRDAAAADRKATAAEQAAARQADRAYAEQQRAELAWQDAATEWDAVIARLRTWASGLAWPARVEPWIDCLPTRADEGVALRDLVRNEWFEPLRAVADEARLGAAARLAQAEREIATLNEQLDALRSEETADPAPPVLWARRPRPDVGAPLWRLVNPQPGLPEHELAAIEAALAASGVLDAWVSDEGVRPDDVYVAPEPPVARGLNQVLVPAEGRWCDLVGRFLAGVHLVYADEPLPQHGLAVALDGRWRSASVQGHASAHHGQAEWLGEAAREAQRVRRMAELVVRVEGAEAAAATARASRDAEVARLAALGRAVEASPTDAELRRLLTLADAASGAAEREAAVADRERAEARAARAAADRVQAEALTFASERQLPANEPGLDEVLEALRLVSDAVSAHARVADLVRRAEADLAREQGHVDERERALRDAESERDARVTAQAEASATVRTLEAMIDADDDSILTEYDELRAAERKAAQDAKRLGRQLAEVNAVLGGARKELDAAAEAREAATAARDEAYAAFRRLIDARVADDLGLSLPEPQSSAIRQVRDQVAAVRGQVRPRDWHDEPADRPEERAKANAAVVARARDRLISAANETRTQLEFGGRSLRIDTPDELPQVSIVVDANGMAYGAREALARLRAIHGELAEAYDRRVQATLDELLGSTFLEHLRDRVGRTDDLVGRINGVLARHTTRTDRTAMRIRLDASGAGTRQVLEALKGSALNNPDTAAQVRDFLKSRVDEAKREAATGESGDWHDGLAAKLDYRGWYEINLEQRRGTGGWGALTPRTYAELSGGARAVLLMMPLVATLAALYEEMPRAPRPLWLDEAFDGLDVDNRAMVMKLFREFDFDVLLAGPGRLVNVAAVPAAAIYQVVRAPAPTPGVDLMLELWSGGQLEEIALPLSWSSAEPAADDSQERLL